MYFPSALRTIMMELHTVLIFKYKRKIMELIANNSLLRFLCLSFLIDTVNLKTNFFKFFF